MGNNLVIKNRADYQTKHNKNDLFLHFLQAEQ